MHVNPHAQLPQFAFAAEADVLQARIFGRNINGSFPTNSYLTTAALSDHSHGNPTLALTNLSGTTASASNGLTLSLAAAAPGAGAVNFSAGTTSGNLDSVVFSNSGGVSFGLNGSTVTATVKTDYLTTAMASNRGSDFVVATAAFAGTSASGTIASNGISVSIGPYITTGALSNHSHGNPTLALTNLTGTTASASNGFTLSLSGNAAGGGDAIRGIAANGSTASTNTVNFSNSNGVSFGFGAAGNSTVITASHNALTTAAQSDHSHGNPTLALTNLTGTTASASNGFTLSLSAAAPGGGAANTVSYAELMDGAQLQTCMLWNNATYSQRPVFVPFQLKDAIASVNSIQIYVSRPGSTSLAATFRVGIYTLANATSMNLVSSTSFNVSLTTSAQFSGIRMLNFTGLSAMSLSPGQYVLGLQASPVGSASLGINVLGGVNLVLAGYINSGTNQTAATASGSRLLPFWGVFNATSNALPAAVGTASISGGNGANSPDIYAVIRAIA